MERRSWPWKKKSSDKSVTENKSVTEKAVAVAGADAVGASLASVASLQEQENHSKLNYVQISLDSYTHLTGLEEQVNALKSEVKVWQNEVEELKGKLSVVDSEMIAKDNMVKQHAKVAEEAVSGWEKADVEASSLRYQLESVTLLKLTAEDRASDLDGAMKECVRQITTMKEENERLLDVLLTKSKQFDKIKFDLESKVTDFDQRLFRSAAENAALSRSLQEHSSLIMKINEEKSQVGVQNELLREQIQSSKKEINSLQYEVNVLSKELDIRNEEKNMSLRSAEAANKQNLESVKKVAHLEAECQRLRGLLRKKLPGPAAFTKIKQEVENWGSDYGESRSAPHKPLGKNIKPRVTSSPEFSHSLQQDHKETEFLTTRLLALEEETKMLKEALAMRNTELQSSRETCAKMGGRMRNLEAQVQILSQRRGSPRSIFEVPNEGSSHASNPQSVASLSEDGLDDDINVSESWVTKSISDPPHLGKEKPSNSVNRRVNANSLSLMDDFLEMERMAHSNDLDTHVELVRSKSVRNLSAEGKVENDTDQLPSNLLSGNPKDFEMEKVLIDKHSIEDIKVLPSEGLFSSLAKKSHPGNISDSLEDCTTKNEITSDKCSKLGSDAHHICNQDTLDAVTRIHQFVSSLRRDDMPEFDKGYEDFSVSFDKFMLDKSSLCDFIVHLSCILMRISSSREEKINSDQSSFDGCISFPHVNSTPEVLPEINPSPGSILNVKSCKCSLELEQLKAKNDSLTMELTKCSQDLECAMLRLEETEPYKNLYSLAETQLKCMAESYRSLEGRAKDLEASVNSLQEETDGLEKMLQEEKRGHEDALARCKDLEDRMHRNDLCSKCLATTDLDFKSKQETEIAAAASKLAECQATIYHLGRQLKALNPTTEPNDLRHGKELQMDESSVKNKLTGGNSQDLDLLSYSCDSAIGIETKLQGNN